MMPFPPMVGLRLRVRVAAWLDTFPGTFRAKTERDALTAARDAFDKEVSLSDFDAALRSCGFRCDASRRSYGADGSAGAFFCALRLPERPRST